MYFRQRKVYRKSEKKKIKCLPKSDMEKYQVIRCNRITSLVRMDNAIECEMACVGRYFIYRQ